MIDRNELLVGVSGPFSGPRMAYGELLMNAFTSVTFPFQPVFEDDEACPEKAVVVAERMIDLGVKVVVGHFNSDCARLAGRLYDQKEIAFLMPASTDSNLCADTCGLRLCANDTQQVDAILAWLKVEASNSKPVVWCDQSTYGERLAVQVISLVEGVVFDISDNSQCQSPVLLFARHDRVAHQVIAAKAAGFNGPFLACDDCSIGEFAEMLAHDIDNVFIAVSSPNYAETLTLATGLLERCDLSRSTAEIRNSLSSNAIFNNGQSRGASFHVVPAKSHWEHSIKPAMRNK